MNTLHVPLSRARKAWLGLPVLAAAGLLFGAPAQSAEPTASTGLYDAGTTPKVVDDGDTQSVELGVRFKASEAGVVQGVRYYKGATNTGTHTGSLWSETGQRIATATFTKESNTGWQTVTFANPVPIKAGTNYVASYYAPNGHYAQEQHTFADGKTLTNGPLTATKGLYTYGRSSFPTSSWRDSSYYVEPVFKAGTASSTPQTSASTSSTASSTASATTSPSKTTTTTAPTTSTSTAPPTSTSTAPTTSTASSSPTATASKTSTSTATTSTSTTSAASSTAFPNESNTGSSGSLSTVNGSLTTSTSGQVVKDKLITGDLVVSHANVTLQNSRVMGRIRTNSGATNLNLVDSEIGSDTCTSSSDYQLLASSSVTATRSHFHGGGADLIRLFGGTVALKDSLVNGGCEFPGDHYDAIQMYGPGAKANVTIDHSTIDGRSNASKGNAAVFWADEPGAGSTLTITNSQLAGGGYTVSLYDANAGSGVFLDVRDNTFVKGSWGYGPCADTNSIAYNGKEGVRFTGNKLSDGATLSTCG